MKRKIPSPAFFFLLAMGTIVFASLTSCLTLSESMDMLASQAVSQGLLDRYQAVMLKTAAKAAVEASRSLTPEEEYYVGRAVAANILSNYPPYNRPELNAYINKIGQGLALYSSRPAIFMGYHFMVLDSEEINAFASPGGHILVTRGLLRKVRSEDELAAVLAHEIAHVALGHGLASVQGARVTQIAAEFAIDAGKATGGEVAAFTSSFGDSISELAKILILSGYSQTYEFQADLEARRIIAAAGYDPNALASLIGRLPSRDEKGGAGFAVTHPDPSSRIGALNAQPLEPGKGHAARKVWPIPRQEKQNERAVDPVLASFIRVDRFTAIKAYF
ncbi:MAG: M48 family metalloprotease [Spirochaetales bacterium]|jgi:predicted Zn-dependent protease